MSCERYTSTLYDVDTHFSVNKFSTTLDDDDEEERWGRRRCSRECRKKVYIFSN